MKRINDGHPLREFLARMPFAEQERYAVTCGTTIGYLRKYLSCRTKLDVALVVNLVAHSRGKVTFASLRPDVDWSQARRFLPSQRKSRRSTEAVS